MRTLINKIFIKSLKAPLLILLLIFTWGCAGKPVAPPGYPEPYKVMGKWYQRLPSADGFREKGYASWYGKKFHGRKTANGETYDMYGVSAAHKTLPLGTYVKVKNLKNKRTLTVRINDRGPFVDGRIIDLSYGAAKKLGVVGPGTAPVFIKAVDGPKENPKPLKKKATVNKKEPEEKIKMILTGLYTIQVGAFQSYENAEKYRQKLSTSYDNAHISKYFDGSREYYRVRIGRWYTLDEAEAYEQKLLSQGFQTAYAVEED